MKTAFVAVAVSACVYHDTDRPNPVDSGSNAPLDWKALYQGCHDLRGVVVVTYPEVTAAVRFYPPATPYQVNLCLLRREGARREFFGQPRCGGGLLDNVAKAWI